jgi:NAD(P)-dependent dehydrogenase (short-subunit alcohol dehydrogenase family)
VINAVTPMKGELWDKVIIVTGGGSGIGEAAALRLAGEGARVVIADRNAEQGEAVVRRIESLGQSAKFVAADVSREADVQAMIAAALSEFGRLDGAYNNAGIGTMPAPITETSEADWRRVLDVNLTGVFLCVKEEIRAMLKSGGGTIVNMASVGGLRGVPMQAAYSASKHGVIGVTKTAAAEYAKNGIRVNAVCPGVVDTPATRGMGIDWNKIVPVPMGRIAKASEVAEMVFWLLSDRSSYVTGQAFAIDGGMTAPTFTVA